MLSRPIKHALAAVVLLLAGLLGAGCAAGDERAERAGPAPNAVPEVRAGEVSQEHNETDLAYAHELGAMHAQAVAMVAMVANKEVSPGLRRLAEEIGRSRSAEFEQLRVLLRSWGLSPHGDDYHGNPGELTMDQLSALYRLEGQEFERTWLERMSDNHKAAVAMSRSEVDRGLNPEARELARALVRVQDTQVAELQRLLDG